MHMNNRTENSRSWIKEPIHGYSGPWDEYVEWLSIGDAMQLEPPNDPFDDELISELRESMERNGWFGPPLLMQIFDDGDCLLLQGSHRLAAANATGLNRIPFLVVRGGCLGGDSPFATAYKTAEMSDVKLAKAVSAISDETHADA